LIFDSYVNACINDSVTEK